MDELTKPFSLGYATERVLELKKDIGKNIMKIGRWIYRVYQNIPEGEFYKWLKYTVKLEQSLASRFSHIAREVDFETFERLGPGKVFDILAVPGELRKDLFSRAKNMTRREIQEEKRKIITANDVNAPVHYESKVMRGVMRVVSEDEEGDYVPFPPDFDIAMKVGLKELDLFEGLDYSVFPVEYINFVKGQLKVFHNVLDACEVRINEREKQLLSDVEKQKK